MRRRQWRGPSRFSIRLWLAAALAMGAAGAVWAQPADAPASPASPYRIAFIGDSMADGLWSGVLHLVTRDNCLKERFDLGRFAKNGTGLTRIDQFSWPNEAAKIVERFHPHLFVVSLGLNDRQGVVEPGKPRALLGSPEWPKRYADQVLALLQGATAAGAQVLWIGSPALRDAQADADARQKNEIFSAAVAEFHSDRVRYVEPWKLSQAEKDSFKSFGPDSRGTLIQIRAADGVHFTAAGYDMVGAYLFPKIAEALEADGPNPARACNVGQ